MGRGTFFAESALGSDKYFMVVLDELTYLMKYGFVDTDQVSESLKNKREDPHVVITGRDAPQELMEMADLVTEMREVRHPLKSGIMRLRRAELAVPDSCKFSGIFKKYYDNYLKSLTPNVSCAFLVSMISTSAKFHFSSLIARHLNPIRTMTADWAASHQTR